MRLLIVEDNKEILDFLKISLAEECFAVDTAEDGEVGSYLARTNDYDVIILDNMLPKKDGKRVCKEIREEGKDTPIIMLSVKSDTTTKIDLLNIGADDYLTKPFSLGELMARIRALLRRPKIIESDTLEIDDLFMDIKKHIVKRKNKEIHLTKKEFMLLEYLMRNRNVVLSRGMIMEHVWDMNADPFSNTIESHIASLRRKIDNGHKRKFIRTVSGRGYIIST
ncbi:response regulator transcription factor [Patescibacteria group bacterium]